ncbi:MAG: hypothetical protein DRR19_26825 [Candidatus Parabeggiatoa sp. nov. 1]|nr:MAG: hypothetical protein DRR19_26825 [Gammaproteobacteria bacterium]
MFLLPTTDGVTYFGAGNRWATKRRWVATTITLLTWHQLTQHVINEATGGQQKDVAHPTTN